MANQCGVTLNDFYRLTGIRSNEVLHPRRRVLCPAPATTTTTTTTTTVAPTTSTSSTTAAPTTTTVAPTTTTLPVTTTVPTSGVLFSETFDSQASMARLGFQVHDGAGASLGKSENPIVPFLGDHDMGCGVPTTYRNLTNDLTVASAVWWCAPGGDAAKGHFMTGMNTQSYVSIAFTPLTATGQVVIFPASTSKVCWDQNATDLGDRKWTQLAVISASRFTGNLAIINPDFEVQFGQGAQPLAGDDFMFFNLRNSVQFFNGSNPKVTDYDGVKGITDKAARYQVCIVDNHNGTVTRTTTIPGSHPSTLPGRFPAGNKVVIFQDESYHPDKSLSEGAGPVVQPFYTFHWDNLLVTS